MQPETIMSCTDSSIQYPEEEGKEEEGEKVVEEEDDDDVKAFLSNVYCWNNIHAYKNTVSLFMSMLQAHKGMQAC